MEPFANLIVGCGLAGMTLAERIATQQCESVLIIDKRGHIGGNAYDEVDAQTGIRVHKYGPHIFHTNNEDVWKYVNKFAAWYPYIHRIHASVNGAEIPIPFNLDSLFLTYPKAYAEMIADKLLTLYRFGTDLHVGDLLRSSEMEVRLFAQNIRRIFFEDYTRKQWGMPWTELYESVLDRVPIRLARGDSVFTDKYQGVPEGGYTAMAESMLANKNIEIRLNTDFHAIKNKVHYDRLFFTGPVDEYFECKYGELPYRSLRFDTKVYPVAQYQNVATINYPNTFAFTRSTEHKHFYPGEYLDTCVTYEYPCAYKRGFNDAHYPIPNAESMQKYMRYNIEARSEKNVYFTGRLGLYQYLNMDETVEKALALYDHVFRSTHD